MDNLDNDLAQKKNKQYFVGGVLATLYLLSQMFPPLWVLDTTTLKHFIFAILNVVSISFILYYAYNNKDNIINKSIFHNPINYAWLLLLSIMLLSFTQAMNVPESIITLNRWVIVYLMFIYFSFFLSKKPTTINALINATIIIGIINILWCIIAFYYVGANANPRKNLYISGFYGNKNIFAAAILFNLPFLYYAFLFRKTFAKWLSLVVVFGLTFCLVILSARTSFIGLILHLILLSLYALYLVFRLNKPKKILIKFSIVIVVALLGFFAGDMFLKLNFKYYCAKTDIAKTYELTEDSYSVSNRFKSIEEGNSKGRLKIWRNTISIIKENPIKGYGVGNHKLAIMKVEAPQKFNFVVSDHAHNDFLEMWSELGIFGLISYLLLFASAITVFLKTQLKKKIPNRTRFVSFVGFLFIVTYMNDAMFNFPLERADCQLYLALAMALILFSYLKTHKQKQVKPIKKYILLIIGFLTIYLTAIETMHFTSSILQKKKILQTNGSKRINYTAEEWERMFPKIPTVDENVNPIALTIGMRYSAEKKWREAIDVIINDKSNPYLALKEYRLSNYYYNFNMHDSAEYWARECMRMKPLCYDPVRILYRKYAKQNRYDIADTIIENYVSKYKFTTNAWIDLATSKKELNKNKEALRVLDSALYYIPDDIKLLKLQDDISKKKYKF
jgi:O-antigen ligase